MHINHNVTAASLLPTICHLVEASGNKFVLHFVLGISMGGCLLDTFILSLDHWEGKGMISDFCQHHGRGGFWFALL